jgi:hypothetical protein
MGGKVGGMKAGDGLSGNGALIRRYMAHEKGSEKPGSSRQPAGIDGQPVDGTQCVQVKRSRIPAKATHRLLESMKETGRENRAQRRINAIGTRMYAMKHGTVNLTLPVTSGKIGISGKRRYKSVYSHFKY